MPPLGHESVALDKLLSLPDRQRFGASMGAGGVLLWDEDDDPLDPPSEAPPVPLSLALGWSHSSPRLHFPWRGGEDSRLFPGRSCESLGTMRHAASVDEIKTRRALPERRLRHRPGSTGRTGGRLGLGLGLDRKSVV